MKILFLQKFAFSWNTCTQILMILSIVCLVFFRNAAQCYADCNSRWTRSKPKSWCRRSKWERSIGVGAASSRRAWVWSCSSCRWSPWASRLPGDKRCSALSDDIAFKLSSLKKRNNNNNITYNTSIDYYCCYCIFKFKIIIIY